VSTETEAGFFPLFLCSEFRVGARQKREFHLFTHFSYTCPVLGKGKESLRIFRNGDRMKKYLFLLFFLVGCATTVAPTQTYSPENGVGETMGFGARAVNGLYKDDIIISINNEDVLFGDITLWRLEDNLTGNYQGRDVQAYCYAINDHIKTLTKHFCTVYIEGNKVVKLSF